MHAWRPYPWILEAVLIDGESPAFHDRPWRLQRMQHHAIVAEAHRVADRGANVAGCGVETPAARMRPRGGAAAWLPGRTALAPRAARHHRRRRAACARGRQTSARMQR